MEVRMNNPAININVILLGSIPIDKHLKRYYISKYRHLCTNNGVDYANAKFKALLCALKEYKASGHLPSPGVRQNGWFKKLIGYVDAQPHFAFAFLKGLTSWKAQLNVEEAENDFHSKLESINTDVVNVDVPAFLSEWYELILRVNDLWAYHFVASIFPQHKFHLYCKHHTVDEFIYYVIRWRKVFGINRDFTRRRPKPTSSLKPVFPELYKDSLTSLIAGESRSFERDYANVLAILRWNPDLDWEDKMTILEVLSDDIRDEWFAIEAGEYSPTFDIDDVDSGLYVGDIHYIPKNGTDYRPIGVPNRFIQSALTPVYETLSGWVQKLPHDATFNQDKFDNVIQSRVTTDSRFIGSVDLSAATEHLPLTWISELMDNLLTDDDEITSWNLFNKISRAAWKNGDNLSYWHVGQPLGSLPSFMVLTLTHNLYIEALSLYKGYGHSPYRVLGDDIVITSKKLYGAYIRDLENRGIPLSLHKSYHGKLTEFAGKVYIKKNKPFLLPDHNVLTWESLFDYQYATGVRIPWHILPRKIKNKITRLAQQNGLSGQSLYESCQACLVYDRGSSNTPLRETLLEKFFELSPWPNADEGQPSPVVHSGLVKLDNMVMQVNQSDRLVKDGLFRRYYEVKLPDWLKRKFRPVSTDRALDTTVRSIRTLKDQ
jgi:hypothetical protein